MTNLVGEMTVMNGNKDNDAQIELITNLAETLCPQSAGKVLLPSALCSAVYQGDVGVLKAALKSCKVDWSQADYDGRMPLHVASTQGNGNMVKFLVGQGCPVNAKDGNGETPLICAANSGHKDVVE